MLKLEKYSMGIGDRFAHQGRAQLRAMMMARDAGVTITPVWNKSHREHTIVHSEPSSVRAEAEAAVRALGWNGPHHVDADHIGLKNVDLFLDSSDFFTLDVADFIGQPIDEVEVGDFLDRYRNYVGALQIPGIEEPFAMTVPRMAAIVGKYLPGVREAGRIYRHILKAKGEGNFITEVSMDETDSPQTPEELFFILAAIADEKIPAQTIAPKFTGRFNKGVDYVGDAGQFAREFEQDLCVIDFAIKEFGLPDNLKISVHSGSDKFSLYGPIRRALREHGAGLHLKTAGTTWLEELIGLAEAGGSGLEIARMIYLKSLDRFDELCKPYATVIDIDCGQLPNRDEVARWDSAMFVEALRHDPACAGYNPNVRQLLHVGYKVAAELGEAYLAALDEHEEVIARNVTENIFARHIRPVFLSEED